MAGTITPVRYELAKALTLPITIPGIGLRSASRCSQKGQGTDLGEQHSDEGALQQGPVSPTIPDGTWTVR